MRVGIIGTGAISNKHAQAYRNIGYEVAACSAVDPARGKVFADQHGCRLFERWEDVCEYPDLDFIDVCTFPDFRLQPVELCAGLGRHVHVQKPMATTPNTAREMVEMAQTAGIQLGVVSQHRFDDASRFLKAAIDAGHLGEILQADAYVKWYRPAAYYSRPVKGSWEAEGGGALITQAIHQLDLLLWFAGPAAHVSGEWRLGAIHDMEAEDMLSGVIQYASGALGVIQASTAFRPGYPERIEVHGTKGTAIITGDQLTTWDVENYIGDPPPLARGVRSGATDPMAISLEPFERQFLDFGDAIRTGRAPLVSGREGLRALETVDALYRACRYGQRMGLNA